jgi:hypothetical protein
VNYDTVGPGIESPKAHANTAECLKIRYSKLAFFRRQHEDSNTRKIAIPVRLSHASSPIIQFNLKSAYSGARFSNELVSRKRPGIAVSLIPRNRHEISDAKSIDWDLPSAGGGQFVSPMMYCSVLTQVGSTKLERKSGFRCRATRSTPRQVPLGFVKPHLWYFKHSWLFHSTNIPRLGRLCHAN